MFYSPGILLYLASTVFWAISLKYESLSKAVPVFILINLVALVLIGVFYFQEKLSTLNIIGILMAIISIILINI